MRCSLFVLGVALACTSAKESGRSAAAAFKDATPASAKPVGAVTATGETAAAGSAGNASESAPASAATALTASEAAAGYAQSQRGAGGDAQPSTAGTAASAEDNSCESDADCAFTRVDAGACCPMLCAPRVVSKKQADALLQHVNSCRKGRLCPEPMCRPPPMALSPSCQDHRCVGKPRRAPSTED